MPTGKGNLDVAGDIPLAQAVAEVRKANGEQRGGLQLRGTKVGLAERVLEHIGVLTAETSVPKGPNGGGTVHPVEIRLGRVLHDSEGAGKDCMEDEGDGNL